MKKYLTYIFIIFLSFLFIFNVEAQEFPNIISRNVILINMDNNEIIYDKNSGTHVSESAQKRKEQQSMSPLEEDTTPTDDTTQTLDDIPPDGNNYPPNGKKKKPTNNKRKKKPP